MDVHFQEGEESSSQNKTPKQQKFVTELVEILKDQIHGAYTGDDGVVHEDIRLVKYNPGKRESMGESVRIGSPCLVLLCTMIFFSFVV